MHQVLLIHGIRTHADWQAMVRHELERDPSVVVKPIKYGYFDLLRFLLPGPLRKGPVESVRRRISWALMEAQEDGTETSVIAHSFGTYAITRILEEDRWLKLKHLVLCGSIVRPDYDWAATKHQISGKIVNEAGRNDIWPAMAASVTWGYGNTGTYGFGNSIVIDRYSGDTHSSFFTEEFVRERWFSLFSQGRVAEPGLSHAPTLLVRLSLQLLNFPFKWVVPGFAFFVAGASTMLKKEVRIDEISIGEKQYVFREGRTEPDECSLYRIPSKKLDPKGKIKNRYRIRCDFDNKISHFSPIKDEGYKFARKWMDGNRDGVADFCRLIGDLEGDPEKNYKITEINDDTRLHPVTSYWTCTVGPDFDDAWEVRSPPRGIPRNGKKYETLGELWNDNGFSMPKDNDIWDKENPESR